MIITMTITMTITTKTTTILPSPGLPRVVPFFSGGSLPYEHLYSDDLLATTNI